MKKSDSDYPVVKCFVIDKLVKFWCPFCKVWHSHGSVDGTPESWRGHRSAHCAHETPFTDTGYIVEPYTKAELKAMGFLKS